MIFRFNDYDLIEKPKIKLCKLELLPLGFLNPVNIVIKPTSAALTELTFTVYAGTNLYDCVKKDMILEVDDFGRFAITDVREEDDGQTKTKSVTANSYEITMNKYTLTYEDNIVFKLWDETHPEACSPHHDKMYPALLYIIQQQTGWTIRHVDASLLTHSRTMSIDKEQAYGYLVGDIAETYKCYFEFDTINKEIYCYDRDERQHVVPNTGINLSFKNLISSQKCSESSEDICTALTVKGAEGVGINLVNPLGNDVIYDFSYYLNDEPWGMPKDLQIVVKAWQDKISAASEAYSEYVGDRRNNEIEKTELTGRISVAEADLKAALDVQSVLIAANASQDKLEEQKVKVEEAQAIVDKLKAEYEALVSKGEDISKEGQTIVGDLSWENNFTPEQMETLSYYINGSVYENSNFVYTDNMPEEKKIETATALYNQGLLVMAKLSSALYEYECDVAPFMFNKKYDDFSKAIKLGDAVNLELEDGLWVHPRIIQVVIDYDNHENTKVILSDSFRLNGSVYQFSDDWTKTVKASRKAYSAAPTWDEIIDPSFYSNVRDYMTNALNLTNQEIINADNQELTIGSYGLRAKKFNPETRTYDKEQIAITNNVIAFTNDNWASTKTALGKVKLGEPGKEREYYGLVAEAIFGNIIAGEHLTIEAKDKQLVMDSSGCKLTNADFTVTNGNTEIKISHEDGFKIRKKNGSQWTDVLSEDTNGNIIAKSITLESGNIGGWTIEKDKLSLPIKGDYIGSDGTGRLSLLSWNPEQATFSGNIYANNLNWRYGEGDYASIFTLDSLGLPTMDGSWLGTGSVGKAKLSKLWVDEIEGTLAEFDEIKAKLITTDILIAGKIGTDDLMFGGKMYVGDSVVPSNNAQIYIQREDISSEIKGQYSLIVSAQGNIHLDVGNGDVIVGGRLNPASLSVQQESTFNGNVTFNAGIEMRDLKLTNWLVVGDDTTKGSETTSFNTKTSFNGTENFFASGFSANGTSSMDTIKFNNIESNNAYNAVGVKCGIEMYGDLMVNDGSPHTGVTTTINIDGQTLRFVKGILV